MTWGLKSQPHKEEVEMDNNNLYGQDNNPNLGQDNPNQPFQQDDGVQKGEPTGYDPMTGQPIYGQPQPQQQAYQQQQVYQQPVYQQAQSQPQAMYVPQSELEEPVSIGDWMITILVMCIPCVNIVMLFVWAFGSGKKSKSNYFKAFLIWLLIWIAIAVVLAIIGTIIGATILSEIF
jgi:hypothetical protein